MLFRIHSAAASERWSAVHFRPTRDTGAADLASWQLGLRAAGRRNYVVKVRARRGQLGLILWRWKIDDD